MEKEIEYKSFEPKELPTNILHEYLLGAVAPRPIAWASTTDVDGNINLSPFSFFNVFGSNPPIMVFSPSRRVRDNTTKHTLENIYATKECVINIVSYDLAHQMVLSSTEYEAGINEFEKAGLTMVPSVKVKAPRVKESPAQFECKVKDVIALGEGGGAGHLIICEVVHLHIQQRVFDENGKMDPHRVDHIARLGGIWYTRSSAGLFQLPNPGNKKNIGFDNIPEHIRNSRYFTGSELARLAGVEQLPSQEEVEMVKSAPGMKDIYDQYGSDEGMLRTKIYSLSKELMEEGKIDEAWRILLSVK